MSLRRSSSAHWATCTCATVIAALMLAACSKKRVALDPCELVPLAEARSIDPAIGKAERMPPDPREKNELCLYLDDAGERRLMVFYWPAGARDVVAHVRGSLGADGSVVEVPGVGDAAAAGYRGGALKLFAATGPRGTIGIRAREPIHEGDPAFRSLTATVGRALGRLR